MTTEVEAAPLVARDYVGFAAKAGAMMETLDGFLAYPRWAPAEDFPSRVADGEGPQSHRR